MAAKWKPESTDDEALCTHQRLGRNSSEDRWCVHLRDHDGAHHYEGDPT